MISDAKNANNTITFRVLSYDEMQARAAERRQRLTDLHGPFYEESLSMTGDRDPAQELKSTLLMFEALERAGYTVKLEGPASEASTPLMDFTRSQGSTDLNAACVASSGLFARDGNPRAPILIFSDGEVANPATLRSLMGNHEDVHIIGIGIGPQK